MSEPIEPCQRTAGRDPQDVDAQLQEIAALARLGGAQLWQRLLYDRVLWNASPAHAQDLAIRSLALELNANFELLDIRRFQCAGLSHRLASFRCRAASGHALSSSDFRLHLIPGGLLSRTVSAPSRANPAAHQTEEPPLIESAPPQSHSIRIRPMLVGVTPVTERMAEYHQSGPFPMVFISQSDARELAQRFHCELPSELQWEYACRAGTTSEWYFGDDPRALNYYATFAENAPGGRSPVASHAPNAFGLFDMHGLVWEWCLDQWSSEFRGSSSDQPAPDDGTTATRVYRGGGWASSADECRSASRSGGPQWIGLGAHGFRLFLPLDLPGVDW